MWNEKEKSWFLCMPSCSVVGICGNMTSCSSIFIPSSHTACFIRPTFSIIIFCSVTLNDSVTQCVWFDINTGMLGSLWWGSGFLIWAINASWSLGKALPCLLSSLTVCGSFQVTFKPDASTAEVHDEHIRGLLKVRANLPPSAQIQAMFRNVMGFMRMCLSMLKAKILRDATKSKPFRTYFSFFIILISNIKESALYIQWK